MNKDTVLILDDEVHIVDQFARALKREGYDVDTAYTGKDGWEKYQKRYYDVVIVDQRMEKMNSGMLLLQQIDAKHPTAKVIMITGYGDERTAIEAHHNHAFDYLTKPVDIPELTKKVNEAMSRKDLIIDALEEWVETHPEEASQPDNVVFTDSGEPKVWSAKDSLEAIKANSPEGRDEYKNIVKLTLDLLTRGKI
ncbi:response regulator [Candidatus Parabeggiatoa sp. HSG14]|uniref:response regulator n=1 Tax=Candidatus Parabeggiatoa sp. HSG14 TaxID=3055593 RepID=UPI0025A908EA|nr:response regulator [Thiotrichales bacterium HSG14]